MTVVLAIDKVSKQFGTFYALHDISFKVSKGEVIGFVGANGAGKTTTISALLGFISPTVGAIRMFGDAVKPHSAHRLHSRVGYAAGDMQLPGHLTGQQYLQFVLAQFKGAHDEQLTSLTKRFSPQLDKPISSLSRGNKQKIALIAAFVTSPELIILDEPTSGLDPVMQEVFLDLVREANESGATIFMSSHYLTEVADVCTRVILMRGGKIVRDMPTKQLIENSGKQVRVVSGYAAIKPPRDVDEVVKTTEGSIATLSFLFRGSPTDLQVWLAGVKQLQDFEITEYSLEGMFKSLYEEEGDES